MYYTIKTTDGKENLVCYVEENKPEQAEFITYEQAVAKFGESIVSLASYFADVDI